MTGTHGQEDGVLQCREIVILEKRYTIIITNRRGLPNICNCSSKFCHIWKWGGKKVGFMTGILSETFEFTPYILQLIMNSLICLITSSVDCMVHVSVCSRVIPPTSPTTTSIRWHLLLIELLNIAQRQAAKQIRGIPKSNSPAVKYLIEIFGKL